MERTKTKRHELYQKAIDTWGEMAQLEMAQEEATELALAIRRFIRGKEGSFPEMVGEIADVEIMIEQIKYMDKNIIDKVKEVKEFKLDRLAKRLENKQFN